MYIMYVYRQMAERSVQEFKSEIAIGLDDMQPAAQQGDKTLGTQTFVCIIYIVYFSVLRISNVHVE